LRNKNLQNLGIGLLNLNKKVQIFEYLLSNVSNVKKKKKKKKKKKTTKNTIHKEFISNTALIPYAKTRK
jgi:hypothetical protein